MYYIGHNFFIVTLSLLLLSLLVKNLNTKILYKYIFSVCCDIQISYVILIMNKKKNYCWRLSHDIRKFPLMTGLVISLQEKRKLHDWLLRICALSYTQRGTAR